MNGPEQILRTLDRNLDHSVRLILYGRAALALGFPLAPVEFSSTMDVDAILPSTEISKIDADEAFWQAIDRCQTTEAAFSNYQIHVRIQSPFATEFRYPADFEDRSKRASGALTLAEELVPFCRETIGNMNHERKSKVKGPKSRDESYE